MAAAFVTGSLRKEASVKALSAGQYIKHQQYGLGVVTQSDAERTTIDFDVYGVKKFVTSLMKYDLAAEVPPRNAPLKRRKKTSAVRVSGRVLSGTRIETR